jgi:hypothetical protein
LNTVSCYLGIFEPTIYARLWQRTLTLSATTRQWLTQTTNESGKGWWHKKFNSWRITALENKYQSLMQSPRSYLWHGYYVTSDLQMVRSRSSRCASACEVTYRKETTLPLPLLSLGSLFVSFWYCRLPSIGWHAVSTSWMHSFKPH